MFEALKKYAVFSGRAGRKEFWLFQLLFYAVIFAASVLVSAPNDGLVLIAVLALLALLALLIPQIAVTVRRLHDTDRSAWWCLLTFIPLGQIVLYVFACLEGTVGENRFGTDPKEVESLKPDCGATGRLNQLDNTYSVVQESGSITTDDKDNEIKELKERLNKIEGSQSSEQEKPKDKNKPGVLANIITLVLIISLIVWLFSDDSESPTSNEVVQETPKIDINDQYKSQIIASLTEQSFQAYWGQGTSLWIENPGYSKSELERFGYKLCDSTKDSGMKQSYIITFWQSLRNGPRGQILKVDCF